MRIPLGCKGFAKRRLFATESRATGLERERKRHTLPPTSMDDIIPNSWSLDDQQILFTHQMTSGEYLELIPAARGEPTRFLTGKGSQTNRQISPDGKWAAYAPCFPSNVMGGMAKIGCPKPIAVLCERGAQGHAREIPSLAFPVVNDPAQD
jgi:hypothetical protein